MVEQYATERISPAHRIRRWCEFGSSTLTHLAVQPNNPRDFHATLLRNMMGDLGVTRMHTTPALAVATGSARSGWGGCTSGSIMVTLQKAGKSRFAQAHREVMLFPGDVVIRDLRRGWELEACLDTTLVSIKVPAHKMTESLGDLGAHLAVPLRSGDRRTDLLASVVDNLARMAFDGPLDADAPAIEQLFFSAARIAFGGTASRDCASLLEQDRYVQRVCRFVDGRLGDAAVTVASLAGELGMSVRTFQRLFLQIGTSPRAYMLARRLDLAAEALRMGSAGAGSSITDIALSCGFNDPGYFSRAFQHRFAQTPSQYLRAHRPLQ